MIVINKMTACFSKNSAWSIKTFMNAARVDTVVRGGSAIADPVAEVPALASIDLEQLRSVLPCTVRAYWSKNQPGTAWVQGRPTRVMGL
jgi:hypothetical protein